MRRDFDAPGSDHVRQLRPRQALAQERDSRRRQQDIADVVGPHEQHPPHLRAAGRDLPGQNRAGQLQEAQPGTIQQVVPLCRGQM
jgi:hypothetical protein